MTTPLSFLDLNESTSRQFSERPAKKVLRLRASIDGGIAGSIRPEFAASVQDLMTRQKCPITLESSAELGQANRFVSAIDKGQVYSVTALRRILLMAASSRLTEGLQPVYVSPLTFRDMTAEALALGLPPPSQQNFSRPEVRELLRVVGAAASQYFTTKDFIVYGTIHAMPSIVIGIMFYPLVPDNPEIYIFFGVMGVLLGAFFGFEAYLMAPNRHQGHAGRNRMDYDMVRDIELNPNAYGIGEDEVV